MSSPLVQFFDERTELVCTPLSSPLVELFEEKAQLVCIPSLLRTNPDESSAQNAEWCRPVPPTLLQELSPYTEVVFQVVTASPKVRQQNQLAASGSSSNLPLVPQLQVDVEHTPQVIPQDCSSPRSSEELVTGRLQ